MSHVLSDNLRNAVLQAAIQGQLTERKPEDTPVNALLTSIKNEQITIGFTPKNKNASADDTVISIPDYWAFVRLEDIVLSTISYGIIKLGKEDPNGVKVLRCSDVKPGKINEKSIRTVTEELSNQFKRTLVQTGDIVINVRGTLGGCAIIPKEMEGYNIAREVALIRCSSSVNKKYVMYLLLSPYFSDFMVGNLKGIAYRGLNMEKLREFPVPLPPIEEQERIVDRVDELISKINEYEEIENQLVKLRSDFPGEMKDSILQAAMQGKLTKQIQNEIQPIMDHWQKENFKFFWI